MFVLSSIHGGWIADRRARVLAERIAATAAPRCRVLDVGCGDGEIAARVLERRPDVSITGVDVLVRSDSKIPVLQFDGCRLPFEEGDFDDVWLVDVLHHAHEPRALLAEAVRVARSGIVIKDHLLQGFAAQTTLKLMDWVGNARYGVALPYNYLTPSEWAALLREFELATPQWTERLGLYPRPLRPIFERDLHVLFRAVPTDRDGAADAAGDGSPSGSKGT